MLVALIHCISLWSTRSLRSAAALSVLAAAVSLGCGPAAKSDPAFWMPLEGGATETDPDPGGSSSASAAGGTTGSGGMGGSGDPQAPLGGSLTFRFTTASFGGKYAPRNVGAVWIADSNDAFVKTLEVWAAKRGKHLVKWRAASGNNVVDAVTSATRSSHVAHESLWDGSDTAGATAPDGLYKVYVEFTESNSADGGKNPLGPWMAVEFTKGSDPQDINLADQTFFKSVALIYTPIQSN